MHDKDTSSLVRAWERCSGTAVVVRLRATGGARRTITSRSVPADAREELLEALEELLAEAEDSPYPTRLEIVRKGESNPVSGGTLRLEGGGDAAAAAGDVGVAAALAEAGELLASTGGQAGAAHAVITLLVMVYRDIAGQRAESAAAIRRAFAMVETTSERTIELASALAAADTALATIGDAGGESPAEGALRKGIDTISGLVSGEAIKAWIQANPIDAVDLAAPHLPPDPGAPPSSSSSSSSSSSGGDVIAGEPNGG